jgi:hypothetical protein
VAKKRVEFYCSLEGNIKEYFWVLENIGKHPRNVGKH